MPANPPTKPPEVPAAAPPEKPVEQKFDRFRPEMPKIPGVTSAPRPAQRGLGSLDPQRILQIAGVAIAVLLLGAFVWWRAARKPSLTAGAPVDTDDAPEAAPASQPALVVQPPDTTNLAAKVDQLSKAWDANKFTFVNALTQESVPAMVIRLPNDSLWAFSLQAPFGRCELEFVTDLAAIAKYGYRASHPMVVNPCDGTVYDPLKVGPLDGNTWARGEIVKGNSLRPPISIDVKVRGRSVIADGIE